MAREWLLRGVDPEELKEKEKIEVPQTPRSKWQNFWYHYKWPFWGCTFLAVVLVVMVGQLFFRDTPDYQVLLMTETAYIDNDVRVLENLLAHYGDDLDGDGKVEVNVQNCLMGDTVHQQYNSGYQMISAHLMAADVVFFIWDEDSYTRFDKSLENVTVEGGDFLTDLPVKSDQLSEDKKLWNWNGDDRRVGLLEVFPEDLYFGVRNTTGTAAKAEDLHQQSMDLIQRFIEDTPTAVKTEE